MPKNSGIGIEAITAPNFAVGIKMSHKKRHQNQTFKIEK